MAEILHLLALSDYEARAQEANVVECPPGGFIHCTAAPEVMRLVANAFYRQAPGEFVVLVLDTDRLAAQVRWEPPEPAPPPDSPLAEYLFPHVFGPLNREAVTAVRRAVRNEAGEFLAA